MANWKWREYWWGETGTLTCGNFRAIITDYDGDGAGWIIKIRNPHNTATRSDWYEDVVLEEHDVGYHDGKFFEVAQQRAETALINLAMSYS